MPLSKILTKAARAIGVELDDDTQRAYLVDLVNEAAEELYDQTDYPGSLQETILAITPNRQVALPHFVGQLRAMREYILQAPWTVRDMRPRYQENNWRFMWRGWRLKGESAIMRPVTNAAPLVLTANSVEDPEAEVIITGPTANARNSFETVTMDAVSKNGTLSFEEIGSITALERRENDITIADVDGNILAVLENNALKTAYIIADVSEYPFSTDTVSGQLSMEVLYKKRFVPMSVDSDEFLIPDYDNVIVDKTIQIYYQTRPGDEDRAILYDEKATRSANRKAANSREGQENTIEFKSHRHDRLLNPRKRYFRPSEGRYGVSQS